MNILYIVNIRIPTEKAHGWQIAKTCEMLASRGFAVELVVPKRENHITDDIYTYYGIRNNFSVRVVRSFSCCIGLWGGMLWYVLSRAFFFLKACVLPVMKEAVIITRDPEISFIMSLRGYNVVYHAHKVPKKRWRVLYALLLRKVSHIMCNSHGTAEAHKELGLKQTTVIPNAVDVENFICTHDTNSLRKNLGLDDNAVLAMYAGHLYEWKGVDTVVGAASFLTAQNPHVRIVCVGGTSQDVAKYQKIVQEKKLTNITFIPHVPHEKISDYMCAADVLLLPNTTISEESIRFTSPIKLFEYLATGKPIVASDLPSIREILPEDVGMYIPADDARALAGAIATLSQKDIERAKKGVKIGQGYSWDKYVDRVVDMLSVE